jgi:hypothetical protein
MTLPTTGTVGTSKIPEQAVWIGPILTGLRRREFFVEWYEIIRYKSSLWQTSFMSLPKFVTAVLHLANSIVYDTYDVVTPAAVRSAATLAGRETSAQSSKKRPRESLSYRPMGQAVNSADSCRDMAAYYRAVLYGQDWNPEAPVGGSPRSLVHMADIPEAPVGGSPRSLVHMKPSDADRLLSFVLRKEFPKTTKLKARAFWKLARASELMQSGKQAVRQAKAFETLKLNKFLPIADREVDQNLAAAVNLQMCANGGIGREMVEREVAVKATNGD